MEDRFAGQTGGSVDAISCKFTWRYSAKENS